MKKLIVAFSTLVFVFSMFFVSVKPSLAAIDCLSRKPSRGCPANQPVACPDSTMCCKERGMCPASIPELEDVFGNVVGYVLGLAGIVFFVLLLIGGFKFITSGGDPKAVEGAKGTITHSVLGLIIILGAYLILVLIKELTGVDVVNFNITLPSQ